MIKLTDIEEKVLKYLVDNGSARYGIEIKIDDVDLGFIMGAIENLEKYGFAKDCSATDSAEAFLTEKGASYFIDLEKELYGNYYEDIKNLEKFIKELSLLQDDDNGHRRFMEICEINNDIKNLKSNITNYNDALHMIDLLNETPPSFESNVKIVSERLGKHKRLLMQKADKERKSGFSPQINNIFKPQNTVSVSNVVEISLVQTINDVLSLENSELSSEEKNALTKMLTEIESLKTEKRNKKKLSEKIKDLGKWVFEKGIPTIASVLPYISEIVKTIKG